MQLETTFIAKAICKTIEEKQSDTSGKTTGIAKTIEKTKQTKKTKISGSMCSQNHRENQTKHKQHKITEPTGSQNHRENQTTTKQDFRTSDSSSRSLVLKYCCYICIYIYIYIYIGFLDGFGYPLILESCFCFVLVFSMVLATHRFWNLGFLVVVVVVVVGFLDGFGYPLILKSWFSCLFCVLYGFINGFWYASSQRHLECACWKCCFAKANQRINLKTCTWPRRNACCQKWCFPTMKQHNCWNVASRQGETLHFNIQYAQNGGTTATLSLSHIYIYIYIYIYMLYINMRVYIYIYIYTP